MKTRAFALIAFSLLLGGCRENLGSVVSHGFCAPPDDPVECAAEAECEIFMSGQFGLALAQTNYVLGQIEWANALLDNGDDETRLNTNDFHLRGYQYEISAPFGLPDAIANYRTSLENEVWIPTGSSRNVWTLVVPPDVGNFLADEMTLVGVPEATLKVKIKAYGVLGDDAYYETGFTQAAVFVTTGSFDYCGTAGIAAICPRNVGQSPVTGECASATP